MALGTYLVYSALFVAVVFSDEAAEQCDLMKCSGPITMYKSMNCTAMYKNEGDCCPTKYDCSHLETKSLDKCYVNGHEYQKGESLREEDSNACDFACSCSEGYGDPKIATFVCAFTDCGIAPLQPGCYRDPKPDVCCGGPEICPDEKLRQNMPKCTVGDKTYPPGEFMTLSDHPGEKCFCDLNGENAEITCKKPKRPFCDPEFHNPQYIHQKCAPIFYTKEATQIHCAFQYRCPGTDDEVERVAKSEDTNESNADKCKFGDLELSIGDKLKAGNSTDSQCIECTCEMPPFLSCLRDEDCMKNVFDFSLGR